MNRWHSSTTLYYSDVFSNCDFPIHWQVKHCSHEDPMASEWRARILRTGWILRVMKLWNYQWLSVGNLVEKTYILHQTFCLDTCASIRIHVHKFAIICKQLHTFIYVHLHVSTHIYIHVHTSKYMFMHLHTCSYLYIHHTSKYGSAYSYMHLHPFTCMRIQLHAFAYIYHHMHLHISTSSFTFVYTHPLTSIYIRCYTFTSMCIHFPPFTYIYIHLIIYTIHPFTHMYIHLHHSASVCKSVHPQICPAFCASTLASFYTLQSECKTSGRWITNWIIVDKYFWGLRMINNWMITVVSFRLQDSRINKRSQFHICCLQPRCGSMANAGFSLSAPMDRGGQLATGFVVCCLDLYF